MTELKIVQITDTHIKTEAGGYLEPEAVAAALERAVAHIAVLADALGGVDMVAHTGDLVDDGAPEEYARFRALITPLAAPFYAVPGNHDDRAAMRAAGLAPSSATGEEPIVRALDLGPATILMLDTTVAGVSHGAIDEEQMAWALAKLDHALSVKRPVLLFAHHPPFQSGVGYMDAIRLEDGARFMARLAEKPALRLFACGHHHRGFVTTIGAAPAIAAPAVAGALALDFRTGARPTLTAEQSAVTVHVWRPEPEPFGTVTSYFSAF